MPRKTQRTYTKEELVLFAQYRTNREPFRPGSCSNGERCWVRLGPPGINQTGSCLQCGRMPRRKP